MRSAILMLTTATLVSCVATVSEADIPSEAKAFAKYYFSASSARVALALDEEFAKSGFYLKAEKEEPPIFSTSWSKIGGQLNNVYFEVEASGDESIVTVSTVPYPPKTPELLAQSLAEMGSAIKSRLSLSDFKLEPANK